MNRLIALAAAAALAGCSAYQPAPGASPANTVHNDAVACQAETLNLASLFIPAVQLVDGSMSAMDRCMAQRGWVK